MILHDLCRIVVTSHHCYLNNFGLRFLFLQLIDQFLGYVAMLFELQKLYTIR